MQPDLSAARPGRSAAWVTAGLGTAYLVIGGQIVRAYGTTWNATSGHYQADWNRMQPAAGWLTPGLLLVVAAAFVRRHRWAVALAAGVMGLSAVVAVILLARALVAAARVPVKVAIFTAVVAVWLAILWAGLSRLRRQFVWLGTMAALPAPSGFPVELQRPPPGDV
jgi:hypothetical protein